MRVQSQRGCKSVFILTLYTPTPTLAMHVSLCQSLALLALVSAQQFLPMQRHDHDFIAKAMAGAAADVSAMPPISDTHALWEGVKVILALTGFVIFFFFGLYVGRVTMRAEPIVIRDGGGGSGSGSSLTTHSTSASATSAQQYRSQFYEPVPHRQQQRLYVSSASQSPVVAHQRDFMPLSAQASAEDELYADPYRITRSN